jgi:hypothetical protein
MSYKLRTENFNKQATAESLKVLKLLATMPTNDSDRLQVPGISPSLEILPDVPFVFKPSQHRYARYGRCHRSGCFCTITRLQANIIIRHLVRNSPGARGMLRQWRDDREISRASRRRAAETIRYTEAINA